MINPTYFMRESMEIIEMRGDDQKLYHLVAHLVMNEKVLNYNLNYPYKTSPEYRWFVARENNTTLGFIPVKLKGNEATINNYYIANDDHNIFSTLLAEVIRILLPEYTIEAVAQNRHIPHFEESGFYIVFQWKRYVKMKVLKDEEKRL